MHSTSAPDAQLECTPCPTHILDKVPDNNTIKNTKKDTKPEEFTFDIFKEEVKKEPKSKMVKVMRMNPKTGNRELMEVAEADVLMQQNGDYGMKDLLV